MADVIFNLKDKITVEDKEHARLILTAPSSKNLSEVRAIDALCLASLQYTMKNLAGLAGEQKKDTSTSDEDSKINYTMVKMGLGGDLKASAIFDKMLDDLIFNTAQATMSGAPAFLSTGNGRDIWDALSLEDRKELSKVYFDAFMNPSFG